MRCRSTLPVATLMACFLLLAGNATNAKAGFALGLESFSGGVGTTAVDRFGAQADLTIGWRFQVGDSSIDVRQLGFFDDASDGLNTAHEVGLWTHGGSLLGTVTVESGTASQLVDGFRFATLASPITLAANQSYVVGAHIRNDSSDIFFADTNSANFASEITFAQAQQNQSSSGFGFPDIGRPDLINGFFGPNIRFGTFAVPEPSSLVSIVLGATMLGACSLRKRNQT